MKPTNKNIPITIDNITSVAVNGQDLGFNGYLDIGLYDTMEDLFVNFIGALTFSIIGYFYVRSRGKGKFAKRFIPMAKNSAMPDVSEMAETKIPVKKEVKATVSGIYITGVRGIRGSLEQPEKKNGFWQKMLRKARGEEK